MSTVTLEGSGLGIDFYGSTQTTSESIRHSALSISAQPAPSRILAAGTESGDHVDYTASRFSVHTLRSKTAMQGLLLAEVGDSMVQRNVGGSGFLEGQRIAPESVTPGGGSQNRNPNLQTHSELTTSDNVPNLTRHGTLLSVGAVPARNAAELKSLLGNTNARLKPGAALLPPGASALKLSSSGKTDAIVLEQAKPRARVEIDIVLESSTCVQGSYLRGHVRIHVRRHSKKESSVFIADGKVRVVGFECIPNEDERYTFYQCSAPLSAITKASEGLYVAGPDEEGFWEAKEGVHILKFALLLPLESTTGDAKGVLHAHSGVTVRYIAMASIKVKDPNTSKLSIAHFYRNVEIWPRLNPSVILLPLFEPLTSTACKSLFMGGPSKLYLTAFLHRLHWIAGQRCYAKIHINNETKKTVRSVTFTLVRTTTVFKPRPHLDAARKGVGVDDIDMDACQTTTTVKHVEDNTLDMGQKGTRGHASAKGWWTGISPGEKLDFFHFILLPPDALTVLRGRLLEVEYTLRISVSAGSLTSDVHVSLPLRIINFLSVDPPPSSPLLVSFPGESTSHPSDEVMATVGQYQIPLSPVDELFAMKNKDGQSRRLQSVHETEGSRGHDTPFLQSPYEQPSDFADDDDSYFMHNMSQSLACDESRPYSLLSRNSEEEGTPVIGSARMNGCERMPRFGDLYHASVKDGLDLGGEADPHAIHTQRYMTTDMDFTGKGDRYVSCVDTRHPLACAREPGSFAVRVQEKLEALPHQVGNGAMEFADKNRNQMVDLQRSKSISELKHQLDVGRPQIGAPEDMFSGKRFQDEGAFSRSGSSSDSGFDSPTASGCGPRTGSAFVSDSDGAAGFGTFGSGHDVGMRFVVASVQDSDQTMGPSRNPNSRLLPRPPATITSELTVAPSASGPAIVDQSPLVQADAAYPFPRSHVNRNDVLKLTLNRPRLAQASSSATSVKAKIAELELRVKMMETRRS